MRKELPMDYKNSLALTKREQKLKKLTIPLAQEKHQAAFG
jgi:hypothetical protein